MTTFPLHLQLAYFDCLPTSTAQDQQSASPSPGKYCTYMVSIVYILLLHNYCCINTAQANCSDHQVKYDSGIISQCDVSTTRAKLSAGTLQYSDVEFCYRPQCDTEQRKKYLMKQCFLQLWCWCSNSDGSLIPGTFQKNMPSGFCGE